jgi:hypothetical protein
MEDDDYKSDSLDINSIYQQNAEDIVAERSNKVQQQMHRQKLTNYSQYQP